MAPLLAAWLKIEGWLCIAGRIFLENNQMKTIRFSIKMRLQHSGRCSSRQH
jgi:hypothetical protein